MDITATTIVAAVPTVRTISQRIWSRNSLSSLRSDSAFPMRFSNTKYLWRQISTCASRLSLSIPAERLVVTVSPTCYPITVGEDIC